MLTTFVLFCSMAGALIATLSTPRVGAWAARLDPRPGRRMLQGAILGAAGGLVLIPVLGLLVSLVFLVVTLAMLAAVVLGLGFLGRRVLYRSGRT